ncbi:hypothetical protein QE152_g39819, partial [Popillia japonica]
MNSWKRNNYKNEHHRCHWEQRKQEIAVKAPKMMKIGTWNVRSANEEGNYKNEHHRSHWEQRKQEIAVKAPKMMKIGTWNVRSANEEGTIKHIMAAMKRYGIQILALQETK